jgi:hypothetical protein
MTVLTAIQNATTVLGISRPDAVYSSATREHVELAALANRVAKQIALSRDWSTLVTLKEYAGDGTTTEFALPADYGRMPKKQQLWSSSTETPLTHITATDDWLRRSIRLRTSIYKAWTKIGDEILIDEAPATGETISYYYVSKYLVLADGVSETDDTPKQAFTLDTDTFRLDETLLELAIIWNWKANKGLPYGKDLEDYEDYLAEHGGTERGEGVISVGGRRGLRGVKTAYNGVITP